MDINNTIQSSGDIIITYTIPGIEEPFELPFEVLNHFKVNNPKIA